MWDFAPTTNGAKGRKGPRTKKKMRARREAIEDARRRALPGYRARTPRGTDDDRAGGCLRSEFVSTAVVPASDESLRALGSKYGRHKGGRS